MSTHVLRRRLALELEYYDQKGNLFNRVHYTYTHCKVSGHTGRPIMNNAYAHIRGLIESGGQCALPGLEDAVADKVCYIRVTVTSMRLITPKLLKVKQYDESTHDEESRTEETG